jgi:hypothetical protein
MNQVSHPAHYNKGKFEVIEVTYRMLYDQYSKKESIAEMKSRGMHWWYYWWSWFL